MKNSTKRLDRRLSQLGEKKIDLDSEKENCKHEPIIFTFRRAKNEGTIFFP